METEEDLTGKERIRFNNIKWRRVNGLYFSKFEDKIEAFRYLQKVARRYAYTDGYTNQIKDLVEDAQQDGVMLYPTQLGRWLRDVFELDITHKRVKRSVGKTVTTLTYDTEVHKILNKVSSVVGTFTKSQFVNTLLRHHCGLDINELIVYLGDIDENPVSVMIYESRVGIQAVYMGWLPNLERKFIEGLCHDGDQHGLEYIKNKCRALGYFTYGLNNEDE